MPTAVTTTQAQQLILAGIDTTGLTEAEVQELAIVMGQNFEESRDGINFRPQRYKINKDAQVFVDPFGNSIDELKAIVLFKQKTRGLWEEGNTTPLCSSFDGIMGTDENGNSRRCAECPQNAWGSGKEGRGKACKEMRRMFLLTPDNALPIQISFPPTSIGAIDNFFSARLTNRISDIARQVKFSLVPTTNNGYKFALAVLKNGDDVPPKQILDVNKLRQKFVDSWKNIAIDDEDYMQDAVEGTGDDPEPY
ncbi:hypothetical protein Desde_1056 [Desulfitobacterium dehalogenans ATCC 51507]|uniref:Uncharacterized protein n=1 Tax=Desulfitobacterium dehalogenans (strain ATCC 51507 / DSM 9161 / JW/IU-DC1) TaxID=756499 RepID=I4A6A4_DESDJ|nr:hypothetical protein [Desulfitobacterium dehalogenans]AFL99488.1 hypothetical protein Desde_1056 [Desulfitobacterium dehalogenans ATCC 51507]